MSFLIIEKSPKKRYIRFSETIGTGAYKDVYRGYDTFNGKEIAWNIIRLTKLNAWQKKRMKEEIELLFKLKEKNPYIINIYSSWMKNKEEVAFITDIFYSGNLKDYINRVKILRIGIVKRWCTQILEGLQFLHQNGIIHRDLKCSNIFVNGNSSSIAIGDFGIAREVTPDGEATSIAGTPEFTAPEVYDEKYTVSADIYSFGMCLLEMVTNQTPYLECTNAAQIWRKVSTFQKPEVLQEVTHPIIKDLIEKCIHHEHDKRPQIDDILQHPFFTQEDIDSKYIIFNYNKEIEDNLLTTDIEKSLNKLTVELSKQYDSDNSNHSNHSDHSGKETK